MSIDEVLATSNTLCAAGRHSEAIELLTEILRDTPDARLYYSRGRHFELIEQPERAVADYSSAIALDPSSADYYYHRGCVLSHSLGKDEEAIADFEKVIELKPETILARQECCFSLLVMGNPDRAMVHATVALALAPTDAVSHFCMGQSQFSLEEYTASADSFTKAVELAPETAHYWAALGSVYRKLGQKPDLENSVLAYTQAIRLNPKALYFQSRGDLRLKLGLVADALADLNHALTLHPDETTRMLIIYSLAEAIKRSPA